MSQEKPIRPKKIVIMGAGEIGQKLWQDLTKSGAADNVVLWNHRADKFEEKQFVATKLAVDQANLITSDYKFTSQYQLTTDRDAALKDADIVIITAGLPRGQTDSRATLLAKNCPIIDPIAEAACHLAPNANYIIATNPVDTLTQRFQEKSNIPHNQIVGLSGALDKSRMIQSICLNLNVPPEAISGAEVIGQHGDFMVPVLSNVIVERNGEKRLLTDWLENEPKKLEEIRNATIKGGGRLIEFKGTKSDYIAPAAALEYMTNAIIDVKWHKKTGRPFSCSAYVPHEDVYTGQLMHFSADGKCQLTPPPQLSPMERTQWNRAITACKEALADLPDRVASRAVA